MLIKTGTGLSGLLIVALTIVGCGSSSTPKSTRPTPRPKPKPFAYTLYTHCGIDEARIGTRYYRAEQRLSDGSDNPPPGWNNPLQEGTMTVTSATTAIFRDSKGHRVTFRLRVGATGFLRICD